MAVEEMVGTFPGTERDSGRNDGYIRQKQNVVVKEMMGTFPRTERGSGRNDGYIRQRKNVNFNAALAVEC